MRSSIQADFLQRVAGLSLREPEWSSTIQRELRVEPRLLHIERSQLRWFIWLGCLLFRHVQLRGGPGADPELAGGIIYPIWPVEELESVVGERDDLLAR